jgi:hypothetical protein
MILNKRSVLFNLASGVRISTLLELWANGRGDP